MNIRQGIRSWRLWLGIAIAGLIAFFALLALFLHTKLILVARLPSSAMEPTIPAGSQIEGQGFDYLTEPPRRGDIVYFRTGGISSLPPDQIFVKRIIGLPGESLRIDETGALFINGQLTLVTNSAGRLLISNSVSMMTNLRLGSNLFYVIGDDTVRSYDSRHFGLVPRENIIGRIDRIKP